MQRLVPEIVVKHRLHFQLSKRGECLRKHPPRMQWSNPDNEYYIAVLDTDQVIRPVLSLDALALEEGVIAAGESIVAED